MFTAKALKEWAAAMTERGAEVRTIGRSVFGRDLIAAKVGGGAKKIIVTAAIHARENVTASLVAEAALGYKGNATVWFVPLVNPDGAELVANGAEALGGRGFTPKEAGATVTEYGSDKTELADYGDKEFRTADTFTEALGAAGEALIRLNGGSRDFSLWKANARGVDLNVNFDAKFGQGRQNVFSPAPENYVGEYPFSEPETRALRDFTLETGPDLTISYHAKGRLVYWYFGQSGEAKERDRRIASEAAKTLGYSLGAAFTDSAGGYKDWCVSALGIPALTIETVRDTLAHPLPENALTEAEKRRNFALINTIERFL